MRPYLITFDLGKYERRYDGINAAIQQLAGDNGWWHRLSTTWIIRSDLTAVQIATYLSNLFDLNDRLMVVQLERDWATYHLPHDAAEWLRTHVELDPV
jgi:hypothetical protein